MRNGLNLLIVIAIFFVFVIACDADRLGYGGPIAIKLRTIHGAQVTYAAVNEGQYARTLDELVKQSLINPKAVDYENEYVVKMVVAPGGGRNQTARFYITADPAPRTGIVPETQRYFERMFTKRVKNIWPYLYIDETGVLRINMKQQATASDLTVDQAAQNGLLREE